MALSALFAPRQPARRRWLLAPLLVLLPVLGLGSRSRSAALPAFVAAYAGDTLWTVMMYVTLLFLWPRLSIARVTGLALGLSFLVEFSQLYHAPWLDAVRAHWLGALFLGRGFLVSDLVCYSVGALLAAGLDGLLVRRGSGMSLLGTAFGVIRYPENAMSTPNTSMSPSMGAEQRTSDAEGLFTAFRDQRSTDRRWIYIAVVPLVPLLAAIATWVSMLGQRDSMRIITPHGIRVVSPGMSQQEVVGLVGHPIGKETRAADGAECYLHGMFSMTEPQTTVYVLCYLRAQLNDMSTRRYSLWTADPNGEFAPAGVTIPPPTPKP